MFTNKEVKSFEVDKNNLVTIVKADESIVQYQLRDFSIFYYDFSDMIKEQVAEGIIENYEYEPIATTPWDGKNTSDNSRYRCSCPSLVLYDESGGRRKRQ